MDRPFSGIGGGADIILIPEIPFHYSSIAKAIRKRESEGNHTTLVVVAEGAAPEGGHQSVESTEGGRIPPWRHWRPGRL
ncbi:MAG: 6-phosphofructokinase [Verrucomicrobiales bacterium]